MPLTVVEVRAVVLDLGLVHNWSVLVNGLVDGLVEDRRVVVVMLVVVLVMVVIVMVVVVAAAALCVQMTGRAAVSSLELVCRMERLATYREMTTPQHICSVQQIAAGPRVGELCTHTQDSARCCIDDRTRTNVVRNRHCCSRSGNEARHNNIRIHYMRATTMVCQRGSPAPACTAKMHADRNSKVIAR